MKDRELKRVCDQRPQVEADIREVIAHNRRIVT